MPDEHVSKQNEGQSLVDVPVSFELEPGLQRTKSHAIGTLLVFP